MCVFLGYNVVFLSLHVVPLCMKTTDRTQRLDLAKCVPASKWLLLVPHFNKLLAGMPLNF